ncbi:MAG: NAD-dependent epimerase/dehydratase family protein [Chloroflexi bacterium]|nr:NAD-dependent epimerase/dehydratase family protein [Chloroflexota bacterium]
MNVLVMGGSRFNGYYLVLDLIRQGHNVTVFNRGVTEANFPPEVRRLYGDRKNHEQLREVFAGMEFDCVQDISAYTLDDVQSVVELFDGRTGHYVFASSTVVYANTKVLPIDEEFPVELGPLQTEYGRNKILCEQWLIKYWRTRHFPVTSARFSMVLGPQNIIPEREQIMFVRLLQGRPILIPGRGTTLGQVGHVDDEAKALRMMMLNPRTFGQIYHITGKQYFTDEGYVDTVAKCVGVEPRKVFVPSDVMDEVSKTMRRPLIQRLNPVLRRWDDSIVLTIDKLRTHLGYEADHTFMSGMQHTYDWFEREGLASKLEFNFSEENALLERLGVKW